MNNIPVFEVKQPNSKWTAEQQTAINLQGGRILVSAAAGSGKTAVLTERVIRLIKQGGDISRFLIVTFTVSAANEMRSRIREALQKELAAEPNNRHIQRQSLLVGRAKICTIDAFCGEIVRKNFQLAGVSPDFRVCNTADDELIKREALLRVFEDRYASNDADFIKGVKIFSGTKSDERYFNLIYDLINWLYSLPYPQKSIEYFAQMWSPNGKYSELYQSPWYKIIEEYIRNIIEGYINKYEYALNQMSMDEGFDKYIEIFEAEKEMLQNTLNAQTPEQFCERLCNIIFKTLSGAKGVNEEIRDAVKAMRDKCKGDINRFRNETLSATPEQYKQDLEEFYPVLCNISKLICDFFTIQQEIKKERNCLSFSDVAGNALRLLINSYDLNSGKYEISSLAKELSAQFDYVMLDEYQDTNLLQNLIFESVSDKGNKLFCVGDVKQSIYRFRRAMPQLFLHRLETGLEAGKGFPAVVNLSKNFRSAEGVINFVNYFFNEMMSRSSTEIEYDQSHMLNLGAEFPSGDYETKVDIILSEKEESEDFAGTEDRKAYAQGRACAREIKKMLQNGRMVFDQKSKSFRPMRLTDIVVLMRSVKNRAKGYLAAFKDEDIPVFSDAASSFYDNYEELFFTAFLETVDNPYNDMSLAATLRSPMYSFSLQELTDIKEACENTSLYDCLLFASETNKKAENAIASIEKYRALSANLPVYRLIWQVFSDFSLFDVVSALGQPQKRIDNLKSIYMQAKDYENSALKGLYGFLRFLEKTREQGTDSETGEAAPSADHVKITTIHKSKGLEYPIVFLCGTDVEFPTDDIRSRIVSHDTLGIGCTLRDFSDNTDYATVQREAVKISLRREMIAEEMRLLYVAMTRAKEKLFIMLYNEGDFAKRLNSIASEIVKGKAPASFMDKSSCAKDWLLYALLKHNCFKDIKAQYDVYTAVSEDTTDIAVEVLGIEELGKHIYYAKDKIQQINMDNIAEILNFKYQHTELCNIPAKVSVSDLKGIRPQDEDGEALLKNDFSHKPEFNRSALKATEKGTAFHRFMQYIDLNNFDIALQARTLHEKGVLTYEEMCSLPQKELKEFLNSPLAERMRKSPLVCREYRFLSDIKAEDYTDIIGEDKNSPVLIQGVIDMFYEDANDNIVLVDYKTDRADDESYYTSKYSLQLKLYAQALEKILKKKVSKRLIYSVTMEKEIEV